MNRYKGSGWYGERYRHYLAAKGIRTRYDAGKISKLADVAAREGIIDPRAYKEEIARLHEMTSPQSKDARKFLFGAAIKSGKFTAYRDSEGKVTLIPTKWSMYPPHNYEGTPVSEYGIPLAPTDETVDLVNEQRTASILNALTNLSEERNTMKRSIRDELSEEDPETLKYLAKKNHNVIEYIKAPKDAKYEFYGTDSKGRRVRLYSKEHKEAASKMKFSRLDRLKKKAPEIERRIESDLNARNTERRENARALYVLLKTGLRPGSYKDTQGDVKAYGVSTLTDKHVIVKGNVVRFKFVGKKGVNVEKVVVDPKMAQIIREQRKPGKELFPSVTDSSLRSYIGKFGSYKTKDLRTLHANVVAERLKKRGVEKKEIVQRVAKELQNTPGVAKGAYIAPDVLA